MDTAHQKQFPIVGVRISTRRAEKFTISFKDGIDTDRQLRDCAARLGMTKGELLREITHSALAVHSCGRSRPGADPLLEEIVGLYRETKAALADGKISPVERERITDTLARALYDVRTRKAS